MTHVGALLESGHCTCGAGAVLLTLLVAGCGAEFKPPAMPGVGKSGEVVTASIDAAIVAVERGDSQEIELTDVVVRDADLRRIGRLKALRTLDLGTKPQEITDDGVLALRDLKELRVLVLGAAPITDRGLAVVRGMSQLERLNLTGTAVTNDGLAVLAELPKLDLLRIGGPTITDAGMGRLASLKQIRKLLLVDCPLTDACLPQLKKMTHLESLYLFGTSMSEKSLAELSEALRPHRVHMHFE